MASEERSREESRLEPAARRRLLLAFVLCAIAAVSITSAVRSPIFDDEGLAIIHASLSLKEILRSGVGQSGQFHPPLSEVVLHTWLALSSAHRTITVRIPAIVCWLGALGTLYWALRPIATKRERLTTIILAGLWPAHLILPVAATWYSLAALLGMAIFGGLLHGLSSEPSKPAFRALAGAGAATVALAYTVYAWPFIVLAEIVGIAALVGIRPFRRHGPALIAVGVAVALAVTPVTLAIRSRVGPMLHRGAGGGPMQTVGAGLALLAGHSAPASKLTALIVVGVLAALVLGATDRRVRAMIAVAVVSFLCLAMTNTLNDKRLLLASLFVPGALGLGIGSRRGHRVLALCVCAALPAWIGWLGLTSAPWLFPRWQDPLDEIIRIHGSGPIPNLLMTREPAVALTAAFACGETQPWDDPSEQAHSSSARWWIQRSGAVLGYLAARESAGFEPFRTIDLVVTSQKRDSATSVISALVIAGWRVTEDRAFGRDAFSEARHHDADSTRLHLIRLMRGQPSH